FPPADLVISESTYGGRVLPPLGSAVAELEAVVRRTVERGGKVLIPTFSLGRTQVVLYCLQQAMQAGRLPMIPIIVDSPLAADIADVYRQHLQELPPAATQAVDAHHFLAGETVRYIRSSEESKELTMSRDPCILIAPSGM